MKFRPIIDHTSFYMYNATQVISDHLRPCIKMYIPSLILNIPINKFATITRWWEKCFIWCWIFIHKHTSFVNDWLYYWTSLCIQKDQLTCSKLILIGYYLNLQLNVSLHSLEVFIENLMAVQWLNLYLLLFESFIWLRLKM